MSKFKIGDHVQTNDLHSKRFGTTASGVIASLDDNERYIELENGQWFCCDELEPMPMNKVLGTDMVNHPPHYTSHPSGIECIQVTEHFNFCIGNAIKYCWRSGLKGDGVEDLKKAAWYIQREIERREKDNG